jgi:hypothetical protein
VTLCATLPFAPSARAENDARSVLLAAIANTKGS